MIKQFAIIGLDNFGLEVLEELIPIDCEIMVIDKDKELIESIKDKVTSAYIADVMNEETIRRLIPENVMEAVIVDLGNKTEVSILICNYLKKLNIPEIIAKANTKQHGEILEIVGATKVVYPNREAAKRIVPSLLSSQLFNYMPLNDDFVIAEIKMPSKFFGESIINSAIRKKHGINIIAIRENKESEFIHFIPPHTINESDIYLVAGDEIDIANFTGSGYGTASKKGLSKLLLNIFRVR